MEFYFSGVIKNKQVTSGYVNNLIHGLELQDNDAVAYIDFVNRIEHDMLGLTYGTKDEVWIEVARNVNCRKLSYLEMIQTLTHEMVHAQQFIKGKLILEKDKKVWKGKPADKYDYYDSPWEKEAYELEKTLFLEFFPFSYSFNN